MKKQRKVTITQRHVDAVACPQVRKWFRRTFKEGRTLTKEEAVKILVRDSCPLGPFVLMSGLCCPKVFRELALQVRVTSTLAENLELALELLLEHGLKPELRDL